MMKDVSFIEQMLQRGKEAADIVQIEFKDLSFEQLNWKPAPEGWSIGQCLDHLIISDSLYFPSLRKIAEGKYEMNSWEKWNPLSMLFGKMLVNQTQEKVKKKLSAPKVFIPTLSHVDVGILDRFQKHQDTLLEYIAACKNIDPDRIHITSPVGRFITYSLRNAITILIQHQHRHINQAIRVKKAKEFSSSTI